MHRIVLNTGVLSVLMPRCTHALDPADLLGRKRKSSLGEFAKQRLRAYERMVRACANSFAGISQRAIGMAPPTKCSLRTPVDRSARPHCPPLSSKT